jgi:hypothetical protein
MLEWALVDSMLLKVLTSVVAVSVLPAYCLPALLSAMAMRSVLCALHHEKHANVCGGTKEYELEYPGLSFMPNPLGDEGFRVKRYDPSSGTEAAGLHGWHVDRGGGVGACRELAVLFYLNDVEVGDGATGCG